MFKAVMIIFVITMGRGGDETPAGIVNTINFETMAQCEFAKAKMDEAIGNWHYGRGDDKDPFLVKRTVECHEYPEDAVPKLSTRTSYSVDSSGNFNSGYNRQQTPPPSTLNIPETPQYEVNHQRWDGGKRWNE